MEPRAVVAAPMGMSDEMTVWTSTQIPHVLRVVLTLSTGIPEQNLRIVAPDVGGGFGGKLQMYREEILALQLARMLGRPVKWNETRSEDMVATHHGRDQIQDLELAATKDGTLLGMKVDLLANMGAYLQIITPGTPAAGDVHVPRRSTRWTRTSSAAPACSPTPPRPTPSAVRDGPRRRSRSSA